jgi:DNA repair protein RadD
MQELRPLQAACVDNVIDAVRKGARAPLVCAPTGFGKTRVGVEFLRRTEAKGNAGLFIAPRIELIDQTVKSLRSNGVNRISVLRANDDRIDAGADIIVATIQTLHARGVRPHARTVVVDECRHCIAEDWRTVLSDFPGAILIGLDATPQRADGRAMSPPFDALVIGATTRQLVGLGLLTPIEVFVPPEQSKHLAEHPVQALVTYAKDRKAAVFCGSVDQSRAWAHECNAMGMSAGFIDSRMNDRNRKRTLERFAAGELQHIFSVGCLTEGWDCPPCDCAILARGVSNESTLIQIAGRIMRIHPGKTGALLVDLLGSCLTLGLPDQEREYTLTGTGFRKSSGVIEISQCRMCGRIFEAHRWDGAPCPACGWQRPARINPDVRRQKLEVLRESRAITAVGQQQIESLRADLVWCRTHFTRSGEPYKPGFALRKFLTRWHRYPNGVERARAGWPRGFDLEQRTGT